MTAFFRARLLLAAAAMAELTWLAALGWLAWRT
jgi:hypothetical protein